MRILGTLVVLGLAVTAFGVAPAAAQESGMTWAGSLYGGYAKIMENDDLLPVPGGSFGGRGNLFAMLDPVLGIGAELGYYSFGSEDYEIPTIERGELNFSAFQATAQAIARGARGSVRPFGTLGLGLYSLKGSNKGVELDAGNVPIPGSDFDNSETDSKFGVNLGGGVQFKPSASSISFGLEARWHTIFNGWINEDLEESALDVVTVMAGINFN
jgi:opacity protein-like surface antigen